MPPKFNRCSNKEGAEFKRVSGPNEDEGLNENEFVTYCIDPDTGEAIRGEVKKKENNMENVYEGEGIIFNSKVLGGGNKSNIDTDLSDKLPVDEDLVEDIKQSAKDENPMFLYASIEEGESAHDPPFVFNRERIEDIKEIINNSNPVGHLGHNKNNTTSKPDPHVTYIKATLDEDSEKARVIALGYVLPSSRLREELSLPDKARPFNDLSLQASGKVRLEDDKLQVLEFNRDTFRIDIVDKNQGALPGSEIVDIIEQSKNSKGGNNPMPDDGDLLDSLISLDVSELLNALPEDKKKSLINELNDGDSDEELSEIKNSLDNTEFDSVDELISDWEDKSEELSEIKNKSYRNELKEEIDDLLEGYHQKIQTKVGNKIENKIDNGEFDDVDKKEFRNKCIEKADEYIEEHKELLVEAGIYDEGREENELDSDDEAEKLMEQAKESGWNFGEDSN